MTVGFARKFISRLESFLPIDPETVPDHGINIGADVTKL